MELMKIPCPGLQDGIGPRLGKLRPSLLVDAGAAIDPVAHVLCQTCCKGEPLVIVRVDYRLTTYSRGNKRRALKRAKLTFHSTVPAPP